MKNDNKGLYLPSSINGNKDNPNKFNVELSVQEKKDTENFMNYNARQELKYNLVYSAQQPRSAEYFFDYSTSQKLNYVFNYYVFPRYGRYTFVYDITDKILIDNSHVLLTKGKKHYERNESTSKLKRNTIRDICDVNYDIDIYKKNDIYDVIMDCMEHDLINVDKTLDQFIENVKLYNISSNNRKVSLISNESYRNHNVSSVNRKSLINNDYNGMYSNKECSCLNEKETIYDFTIDKSIDYLVETLNNGTLSHLYGLNNKSDINYIQNSLKNDYKLREITERIYIDRFSDINIVENICDKNCYISSDENDFSLNKDKKNIIQEGSGIITNKSNKYISDDATILNYELKKHIKNISNNSKHEGYTMGKIYKNIGYNDSDYTIEKTPTKDISSGSIQNSKYELQKSPSKNISNKKVNLSDTDLNRYPKDDFEIDSSKKINQSLSKISSRDIDNIEDFSLYGYGYRDIKFEHNSNIQRYTSDKINLETDNLVKKDSNKNFYNENDIEIKKDISNHIKTEEDLTIEETGYKNIMINELQERLSLHKRFWFVKTMGKIDYKILPNKNFNYPASIDIFVEKPNFIYLFEYEVEYQDIKSDKLIIDLYNYNYDKFDRFIVDSIIDGKYEDSNMSVEIQTNENKAKFQIKINHNNLYYMIVRQPTDINGYPVFYTVTKKFLGENKHPIPFGEDMGIKEIPVHINVMVDFINILMLMWSRFYYQFTGYVGIQAIYGIVNLVYEWLTLETSDDIYQLDDYYRCFRWLRWEAEKMYNIARHDPELTGNAWVENLIYEMVEYMEMHHMDDFPEFNPYYLMDEYRNIFDDPSFDIDIVLDKVKGIRKRVIDTNKINRNQK